MLILKVDNAPILRELNPPQIEHLLNNPALYLNPAQALREIDKINTESRAAGAENEATPPQQIER